MPHEPTTNLAAAGRVVDALARAGVRHACVCPGSRSAPLAVAVARHPGLREWMLTDERSAGFFALGMARELAEPVLLLSTSGTAAANFLPAVVEANLSAVPLVVVTADRPPELRDIGAAQTIDQVGLFGANVRWSTDLAPPAADVDLGRHLERVACRAVALATTATCGPVHVNVPYRDPLVPAGTVPDVERAEAGASAPLRHVAGATSLDPAQTRELAAILAAHERGLIVCGPRAGIDGVDDLAALAERLRWPVLADPLSNARFLLDAAVQADAYDLMLRDEAARTALAPDAILHFGGLPVSKALQTVVASTPPAVHVVVSTPGTWPDPLHTATCMVHVPADAVTAALAAAVAPRAATPWWERWRQASARVRGAVAAKLAADAQLFEGKVVSEVRAALPDGATLHVGNSMPVRDLDTFAGADGPALRVACNRGANGIDGVVSTALGAAAVSTAPVALVVGDLSFLHDAGAMQIAAQHRIDALVVVVDNDGGGVFSFLPQAGYGEVFERSFATPHGLDLQKVAAACGADVHHVTDWESFGRAVRDGIARSGLGVVHVRSDRADNERWHRDYAAAAASAVAELEPRRASA